MIHVADVIVLKKSLEQQGTVNCFTDASPPQTRTSFVSSNDSNDATKPVKFTEKIVVFIFSHVSSLVVNLRITSL